VFVTIRTADGLDVVFDDNHWQEHIVRQHPELEPYSDLVIETLRNPDGVFRSKRDRSTRIYMKACTAISIGGGLVDRTSLLVCVRGDDGFLVTAYFASAMWRSLGERIWPS
jgi:hypothetical protein